MDRNVIAVVEDLFFASKIRGTGEQLGVTVSFARTVDALMEAARRDLPALIICDLNSTRVNPFDLARQLKADEGLHTIPLLGFFSHVQIEIKRQAEEAGFDEILPRSVFSSTLSAILAGSGRQD